MNFHRTAAILSVGDELTLGQTLDTNSQWLARRLLDLGIVTQIHLTIADDLSKQAAAISTVAQDHELLIISGGLGPTADDLTRDALARASDDVLIEDELALAQVEAWYTARGRLMPAINRVQALRPARGLSLPNLNGTAPGLHTTVGPTLTDVFCLPGPPREMVSMFEQQVMPRLRPNPLRAVHTRVLHCFGIGESDLATNLGNLMDRGRNPLVGTTASGGVVSIRIRFEGVFDDAAARALHETESTARAAAGPYMFGEAELTFPASIVQLLSAHGKTLATVESCTGGLLGGMITDVGGSSQVYKGGFVTYTNELKQSLVGVPPELFSPGGPGAVSAATARAMAMGGVKVTNSDFALSITGVAGPGGGSKEKPVGTVWIAVAGADGSCHARRFVFSGDRALIRQMSCMSALAMLRQKLTLIDAPLMREHERA
jgi:nicotinamide-nucleotide amidase